MKRSSFKISLISLCLLPVSISLAMEELLVLPLVLPKPDQETEVLKLHNYDFGFGVQCNGYLTNNPAESFCSDEVPEDWREFEFNGERMFMVPLKISEKE